MGVLNDKLEKLAEAKACYTAAVELCENDPDAKLQTSTTLRKAAANLAVVLER